ncbi:MAG TPA: FAD-dependent oxidoreductase [Rugosimonospora sp.]
MADIKVYGAPWCPDCRRAKKFMTAHRIPYDWIDIDQDPAGRAHVERVQNGGRTIPTVAFPDGSHLVDPGDDELAEKLGLAVTAERESYDLVIVGGGPAGLAAAIYAAREGIEALVVEKAGLGGQAGVTERIENYPGFPEGIDGGDLADRFIEQARRYGVELLQAVAASTIEADGGCLCVRLGGGQEVCAPTVLISTGSTYRRLGIPGEDELVGAGVHFCAVCDGPFYRGVEELMVIGGGNSGLEEALYLSQFAGRIRVVTRGELTASALVREKIDKDPRFVVHTNTDIVSMAGEGGRLTEVLARDRAAGRDVRFTPAAAFVFIGLDPNTGWLGDTLRLDRWGFVVTDDTFATSVPGVFCAGDVRAGATKQLGSAVGDGIAALIAIRSYLQRIGEMANVEVNA